MRIGSDATNSYPRKIARERRKGRVGHMTLAATLSGNAVAPHISLEPFRDFASAELSAYPLVPAGVCLNPMCSKPFEPSRDWQVYCCDACRDAGKAEFRKVGFQAAPALLAHRLGKYQRHNAPLLALSNAGRRYLGQLQSVWLADRQRRMDLSGRRSP